MHFNFFPSMFVRPERIRFEHQEQNEIIELFLRQHWIVNVGWIITSAAAVFLPLLVVQLDQLLGLKILDKTPPSIILGAFILWYMLLAAFIFEKFLFWYFNIYIVTNLHLVDINFNSLLHHDITEVDLRDIQSTRVDAGGIGRSFFNYGTLVVKTAAEKHDINFRDVPFPSRVADVIQDLRAYVEPRPGGGGGNAG